MSKISRKSPKYFFHSYHRYEIVSNKTYKMYMMTPSDQISHDLSYFSGPRTSGAENKEKKFFLKCQQLE